MRVFPLIITALSCPSASECEQGERRSVSTFMGVWIAVHYTPTRASQVALVVKNPPANAGDLGSIPDLGRAPGRGHGNPL